MTVQLTLLPLAAKYGVSSMYCVINQCARTVIIQVIDLGRALRYPVMQRQAAQYVIAHHVLLELENPPA